MFRATARSIWFARHWSQLEPVICSIILRRSFSNQTGDCSSTCLAWKLLNARCLSYQKAHCRHSAFSHNCLTCPPTNTSHSFFCVAKSCISHGMIFQMKGAMVAKYSLSHLGFYHWQGDTTTNWTHGSIFCQNPRRILIATFSTHSFCVSICYRNSFFLLLLLMLLW